MLIEPLELSAARVWPSVHTFKSYWRCTPHQCLIITECWSSAPLRSVFFGGQLPVADRACRRPCSLLMSCGGRRSPWLEASSDRPPLATPAVHREGKAPMEGPSSPAAATRVQGVYGIHPSRFPSTVAQPVAAQDCWHVVVRSKSWHRVSHPPPLPPPRRPVPLNLVGCSFNCLRSDHVVARCPNVPRCLWCHREGHQTRSCKRSRSLDAAGPPSRAPRPASVVVIHLGFANVTLAKPRNLF
jgi:hypothetical protein